MRSKGVFVYSIAGDIVKTYAEITEKYIKIREGNKITTYPFPISTNVTHKCRNVILVANINQVGTAIINIDTLPVHGPLRFIVEKIKKRKYFSKWELVEKALPIGVGLNVETHVFDGIVCKNRVGEMRFMISTIPIQVANDIVEMATQLFGSVYSLKCMDTMVNYIYRKYAEYSPDPFLVIYPQGDNFTILLITNNLPFDVWHVSNDVRFREAELRTVLEYVKYELPTAHEEKINEEKETINETNKDDDMDDRNSPYSIQGKLTSSLLKKIQAENIDMSAGNNNEETIFLQQEYVEDEPVAVIAEPIIVNRAILYGVGEMFVKAMIMKYGFEAEIDDSEFLF